METDKLTSVAFPALGTGLLNFERTKVAKTFFEEVTKYLTAKPQTAINDIRFVVYDQATIDVFLGM